MAEKRLPVLSTATAAVAVALCLAPAAASAATITPTASFVADNHTDDANCSLREAVTIANENSNAVEPDCSIINALGNDTIVLGAGTYLLDIAGADGGNANATGDLDADTSGSDLTIDGAGAAATTIDSNLVTPTDRVLASGSGSGSLTVSDLTVTGGDAGSSSGGGIFSNAELTLERARVTLNTAGGPGGGVQASGSSLSITDSDISDNTGTGSDGGGVFSAATTTTIDSSVVRSNSAAHSSSPSGGGIEASNTTLTIADSAIADNDVTDTDAVGAPSGGGLAIGGVSGSATIRGTTLSQNRALGGSSRFGAGIRNASTTSATLINTTVSANEALGAGGNAAGLDVSGGTVTLAHTTFGPNPVGAGGESAISRGGGTVVNARGSVIETSGAAPACGLDPISLDDNVFTDTSCGPGGGNDEVDADPMLGPLMDNSGPDAGAPGFLEPIPTHAPAAASTAVDHVPAVDCDDELLAPLLVDQRGALRPQDGDDAGAVADCEAGSVEISATPVVTPPAAAPPAEQPSAKKCKKGQKLKKGKCVKKKRKKK